MPKQLHEIKKFISGTVSTPSERDVPEDAASYSKNIDSVTRDGILKSIPTDVVIFDGSHPTGKIKWKAQPNTDDIIFLGGVSISFTTDTNVVPRCTIGNNVEATIDNLIVVCEGISALDDVATFVRDGIDLNIEYKTYGYVGHSFNMSMTTTAHIIFYSQFLIGGSSSDFDKMEFIKDQEKYHLVAYKKTTGEITLYEDFYGERKLKTIGFAPANSIEMIKNNKELHVGTGSTAALAPQWIGLPLNKWFGGEEQEEIIKEDATIRGPDSLEFVEKYSSDGTHIYGARFNGDTLYKISEATGELAGISDIGSFINIKAVSQVVGDYIYVFDSGWSEYGELFKVELETMTIAREFQIDDYLRSVDSNGVPTTWISDLIVTTNKIWFAHNTIGQSYEKMIWNAPIPDANGQIQLTDRTPCSGTDIDELNANLSGHEGEFVDGWHKLTRQETTGNPEDDGYPEYNYFTFGRDQVKNSFHTHAISLITPPTGTYVGWFVGHTKSETSGGSYADDDGDGYGDGGSLDKEPVYGITESTRDMAPDMINDKKCLYILHEDHPVKTHTGSDPVTTGGTHAYLYSLDTPMPEEKVSGIYYDGTKLILSGNQRIAKNTHTLAAGAVGNAVNMTSGWTVFDQPEGYDGRITTDTTVAGTDYYILHTVDTSLKIALVNKANNSIIQVAKNALVEFIITPETGTAGSMPYDKKIYYKVSFTYDGYQESPLSNATYIQTTGTAEGSSTTSVEPNHDVQLKIMDRNVISKRISHINVYATESPAGGAAEEGYYRLIRRGDYKISSPKWYLYSSTPVAKLDFENDNRIGQSYEHRTGLPEVLRESNLFYSLATSINNTLIVGGCHHEEIDGAENWLFKSLPYRYDIFNWATDYLKLPDTPNDIISFKGRVYCFTDNQTFRINPDSMIVEDVFDGAGCVNNNSTLVTEYGMFFVDTNNIYSHDALKPRIISQSIAKSESGLYGWQEGTVTSISLSFDTKRNSLLVFHTRGSTGYCWAFNLPRKRWDLWDAPANITGTLIGKDGEVYISDSTKMYHYLGGSGFRTWEWESKSFAMDTDTQSKMYYKLRGIGDAHTLQYKVNDGSSWTGSWQSLTNEKVISAHKKSKSIKIKIIPTSSTDTIDSLGIIFRRLPTK